MAADQLYRPEGSTKVTDKATGCFAYLYRDKQGHACVMAYTPRSKKKPAIWYRCRNEKAREQHVTEFFTRHRANQEYVQKNRAIRTNKGVAVGDIFYTSWGWEQTNIDFYQVVGLVGNASVNIRPIRSEVVRSTGFMSNTVKAVKDAFCGPEQRVIGTGNADGKFTGFKVGRHGASKWDGREINESHYA